MVLPTKWRNLSVVMLHCSFMHALQQQIFANMIICWFSLRIMRLNFFGCKQTVCCLLVKNKRGLKPTSFLRFCESVYQNGKSNHWLLLVLVLCLQYLRGDSTSIKRNTRSNIIKGYCKLAWELISMQHADTSISIQNPRINSDWSYKTTTKRLFGLMNQNMSELSWCVPLFCMFWIRL